MAPSIDFLPADKTFFHELYSATTHYHRPPKNKSGQWSGRSALSLATPPPPVAHCAASDGPALES
jgi:hypothetical protein